MSVTRERFEQGMTYEAYKAQMTRNRDRLEENERAVKLRPEDTQFFAHLVQPLHALVLVEDWCGDVINNVPVLVKLAEASGKLNLRFFLRDQNLDIMDQYLNRGVHRSIPTVVFFDQDFHELGHWIERPALITDLREQMLGELYATAPELAGVSRTASPAQLSEAARNRLMQANADFRAQTRDRANEEVVREMRDILSRALSPAAS